MRTHHKDAWGEATKPEATIDEALRLIRPGRHLTPEVIALLATELPGVSASVSEVAAMTPLRLAAKLIGMPSVEEDHLMDIAREVIANFQALLAQGQPAAPRAETPAPPPPPAARKADAPKGKLPEREYRALLHGAAQGRLRPMSGTVSKGPVVIQGFTGMSGTVKLNGTIILSDSSTMSGTVCGTAYAPPGVSVTTLSGDNDLDLRTESYEALCKRAGLL
jgi:hypothetical protein